MLKRFCDKCGQEITAKKYRHFKITASRLSHYPIDKISDETVKVSECDICEDCLPKEMKQDELGTNFEAKAYFLKGL